MKFSKLISPFIILSAVLFLFSCGKESDLDDYDQPVEVNLRGQKVDICHNSKIKNVSINAVPAHQAHGDAVDMDGDGYFDGPCDCVDTATDCNDNNAAINPSAAEVCDNSVDDNCDGNVDEDCTLICEEGEVEIDFNGPLFVAPADEAITTWQGAINACAAKSELDGCDWFLPNLDELNAIFANRNSIGGFNTTTTLYWSSLPTTNNRAWVQNFENGQQSRRNRIISIPCRCVRR